MAFSMGWQKQSCQPAGGNALAELAGFRQEMRRCLWRRPDALFELADAVLTAGPAVSLPYLSLEPAFRRGHGTVYQGLAGGGIDEEALRDLLVAWPPRAWPLAFAVDASTYPRPGAATSPGREWHHHSCPGMVDGAAVAGWSFQWLSQLSFDGRFVDRAARPSPGRGRGAAPEGRAADHRALGPAARGRGEADPAVRARRGV